MAATRLQIAYVASMLGSVGTMFGGLLALSIYPLFGVLITLGGMAGLLYGAAGLCGAPLRNK